MDAVYGAMCDGQVQIGNQTTNHPNAIYPLEHVDNGKFRAHYPKTARKVIGERTPEEVIMMIAQCCHRIVMQR
jgi:hypothetical protein